MKSAGGGASPDGATCAGLTSAGAAAGDAIRQAFSARLQIVFRYADSEEVISAGAAYYIPPGHLPLIRSSAKTLEFTKTEELGKTMQTVNQNVAAGAQPIPL